MLLKKSINNMIHLRIALLSLRLKHFVFNCKRKLDKTLWWDFNKINKMMNLKQNDINLYNSMDTFQDLAINSLSRICY